MRLNANEIVRRYEALKTERADLDLQFELLERFVAPGRGRFFSEGSDQEDGIDWRHREIYDGVAINSSNLLASNIHSALTSSSTTWFELRFRDETLNDDREASKWLENSAERLRASFSDSNFGLEVSEFYLDGVSYGTTVMLHNEIPGGVPLQWNGHRFKSEFLRRCYFEEDSDGRVSGLFMKHTYTPMQLLLKFGRNALPERVLAVVDEGGSAATEHQEELVHAIYLDPDRQDADVRKPLVVSQRPYAGRWVMVAGQEPIGDEEGYYEMPGYVLRWARTSGSKYGHSPGIIALGDILTLQEMVEMVRTSTEKTVDPPMAAVHRGVLSDVKLEAGGITAIRKQGDLAPLLPPGSYRVDAGWQDIQDLRNRIEQYFFVDSLSLKESPAMTATEVQVRYEMMQRLLGPTLQRIQADFLDLLIQRSFWMMARKGALEEMPQSVASRNSDLDIEYVGPLARAQRLAGVDSIERWLAIIANLGEFVPEILDLPDVDGIGKHIADILGVPAKLVRSEADVKKLREARQKRLADEAAVADAQGVAKAAKDAAQAGQQMQGGALPQLPGVVEEAA